MPSSTPNIYDVFVERGFLAQCTDAEAVRERLANTDEPVTCYIGFDPTAGSLHLGHLIQALVLKRLQNAGHRPIALLGGGTAMVGDPSGKSEMRQMLQTDAIDTNIEAFKSQLGRILDIENGRTLVMNNADWLRSLNYIDFLRHVGRHFSVNRMLSAEAYKQRLEKGLSFIEFNYQLLQAYDFVELYRREGCTLQLGGDDQWGNIVAGTDLGRRLEQVQLYGLTIPLLLTADGKKMGKTENGAVWIDPERFSPFDFYQYWINVDDRDVHKLLALFTDLPMTEINTLPQEGGAALNTAKSILAYEATLLVHGRQAADTAHQGAMTSFGNRVIPSDILPSSQTPRSVAIDVQSMPTTKLEAATLEEGIGLLKMMVQGGLAASNSEARRFVSQGAVKVNDIKVEDATKILTSTDLSDEALIIRVGKKKVHRFRL